MDKKKYEAPLTKYTQVELENGFMTGSVFKDDEESQELTIENQDKGADFDFTTDENSKWGWQ